MLFIYFYFVFFSFMYVCLPCTCLVTTEARRGCQTPETRVTDNCEPIQFKTVLRTNMVAIVIGLFIELKEDKAW